MASSSHRIRLEVSSSNFPHYDRNPNTGHPFGIDAEVQPANQTVYHDPSHAASLHCRSFLPSAASRIAIAS